jgi:outer membrane protein assembly factor BamB
MREAVMRKLLIALAAVALLLVSCDWPQLGFDGRRTGHNPWETEPKVSDVASLTTKWTAGFFAGGDANESSPAISNGTVFVASDVDLYVLDAKTGALKWSSFLGGGAPGNNGLWTGSSPAVDNGIVFVGTNDGLSWLPASGCGQTGCLRHYLTSLGVVGQPVPSGIRTSPAIANGTVFVTDDSRTLWGLPGGCAPSGGCDPSSSWRTNPLGSSASLYISSPASDGQTVFVGANDGTLYAFPAAGCGGFRSVCSPSWTATLGSGPLNDLAVDSGTVFVGSGNTLYALSTSGCGASTCAPQWHVTVTKSGAGFDELAVANGVVYGTGSGFSGYLSAVPEAGCGSSSCTPSWQSSTAQLFPQRPAVANGVVYVGARGFVPCSGSGSKCGVGTVSDSILAFNASGCGSSTCAAIYTSPRGFYGPVAVSGGTVFAGSLDQVNYHNSLIALQPSG